MFVFMKSFDKILIKKKISHKKCILKKRGELV